MNQGRRFDLGVVARSALFHLCSWLVTLVFLPLVVLVWAPLPVALAALRAFVGMQLWLLRVICGQAYRLDLAAVPTEPVILAVRHEALWETLVLPLALGNPVVFLKDEILRYPIAGIVARKLGYIGLDRSGAADRTRAAFQEARARADEGRSFLIFPSGTRDPAHRDRVQKGVAVLYRALGLSCVPIVLDSGRLWPHRSWLRHPGTIEVRALAPIPAGLRTSEFVTRLESDLRQPV